MLSCKSRATSFFCCCWLLLLLLACVSCLQSVPPATLAKLQATIRLTKQLSTSHADASTTNTVAKAEEACQLWSELLLEVDGPDDSDKTASSSSFRSTTTTTILPSKILTMCHVLYASCLVRIGRDEEALLWYSRALEDACSNNEKDNETWKRDAMMGRGRALQRLLRYDEAQDQFLQSTAADDAAWTAAATCALRLGHFTKAREILLSSPQGASTSSSTSMNQAQTMLAILELILSESDSISLNESTVKELAKRNFLLRWVRDGIDRRQRRRQSVFSFPAESLGDIMELVQINVSPFDEHHLIHLDDKVLLHNLLVSEPNLTESFWPCGITHYDDHQSIDVHNSENLWFHKRRSGYGSYGNRLLTSSPAGELLPALDGDSLLQRMVRQPLLLEGRKFSLRIYVVYFSGPELEAHVSTRGLVKVASLPVETTSLDGGSTDTAAALDLRVHTTNSGREDFMVQKDLKYFQKCFEEENDWSYTTFWNRLRDAVRTTLDLYHSNIVKKSENNSIWQQKLSRAGIPKVLGCDFVVDEDRRPWLIEVNRFPGLEARDNSDRHVKKQVLVDAWYLAIHRRERDLQVERETVIFFSSLENVLNE